MSPLLMQHQEVAPPEELRDTIQCFWYSRLEFGETRAGLTVLPDGYAEVIFHFGSACSIDAPAGLQPLPSPFLVGLLNQPVLFYAQHQLEVLGIRCFPWMVFELLELSPGKERVRQFEHPIAQLQAPLRALVQAGRIAEALTQLAEYFQATRARMAADHRLLGKAGEALRAAGGTLPVRQVAAAAHATVRTLERKFKRSAGYTVKDVSGLMRFEQVRNQLWRDPATSLAGLAQELGYADQAHLSREFKRYSGTTPAAFARQTRQAQQTAGSDFVAFVQA